MHSPIYPPGTVRALIQSHFVTPQTAKVLQNRLHTTQRMDVPFFDDETFMIADAICAVLFPQEGDTEQVPLAILLEKELATSKGKGWRYLQLPPTTEAIVQGIKAIDAEAEERYQKRWVQLTEAEKEALLTAVQKGTVQSVAWADLPPALFFEELLAITTEIYYSHPLAKEKIGDVSFADVGGWQHLGLNNLEDREPKPTKTGRDAAF